MADMLTGKKINYSSKEYFRFALILIMVEELVRLETSHDPLQSFLVGRLVFAKVKGFCAWPAKVVGGVRLGNGVSFLSSSLEQNKLAL